MQNYLAIQRRKKLTTQQSELLKLMLEKVDKNETLKFDEVKNLWINYVANISDGKPVYFEYYHHKDEDGEWRGGYSPLLDYCVDMRVNQWLTLNIGSLVIKGYLKIIPNMEMIAIN